MKKKKKVSPSKNENKKEQNKKEINYTKRIYS